MSRDTLICPRSPESAAVRQARSRAVFGRDLVAKQFGTATHRNQQIICRQRNLADLRTRRRRSGAEDLPKSTIPRIYHNFKESFCYRIVIVCLKWTV